MLIQRTTPARHVSDIERTGERIVTTCRDGSVVWRVWGSGPPVLLGHGAQGSWTHWIRNIETLAERHTVIAADLPGHGDSGMPAGEDHRSMTAPLARGLRQIVSPGTRVDLVGFSFGGVIMAYLAAHHPDLFGKLVLVGTPGLGTPAGDIRLQRVHGQTGDARRAALTGNLLQLMLHRPEAVDDLAIHLLVANAANTRLKPEIRARLTMPDKLQTILPAVRARVAAIWGECDRPLPGPELQEKALRQLRPSAPFHVIPKAGHWVMYERPDLFNAALLGILRSPCPSLHQAQP
ncbi:MAG: alpha/beta fold hydrolase [Sphingomonadales bacterium]|nr:alpha/beta fold hydrolase [Sphingomonadales bacterium]